MMTDISAQLTQLTLGIDQLYRAHVTGDSVLDREGLVPVILTDTPPAHIANWDDADARLLALTNHLSEICDAMRRDYLAEMIESLRGLVASFRGDKQNYTERVERCLRVPARPVSREIMDDHHRDIERLLKQMGYVHGNLTERVARWEADHQVPPDDVPTVLSELLNEAKRRTDEKIFPLPDLTMKPIGVRGVPFAAYCGYLERELRINMDYLYTRPALKHLACHESFPGHTVHLAVREEQTKKGLMPLDGALVVTSSASSPLFEGIGDNGIRFLDWIEGAEDELAMTLSRVRAAARVNAALMIHHERAPMERVRSYLQETCFVAPGWAESRIAFLTYPLRAPFIFAYWYGDQAVEKVWRRVKPDQRKSFFEYLYFHMHTPTTLEKYWGS